MGNSKVVLIHDAVVTDAGAGVAGTTTERDPDRGQGFAQSADSERTAVMAS